MDLPEKVILSLGVIMKKWYSLITIHCIAKCDCSNSFEGFLGLSRDNNGNLDLLSGKGMKVLFNGFLFCLRIKIISVEDVPRKTKEKKD